MRIFKLSEHYDIVCESKGNKTGFKHKVTLLYHGIEQVKTSIQYYNRTWERFTYESVIKKVIGEHFNNQEREAHLNTVKNFN